MHDARHNQYSSILLWQLLPPSTQNAHRGCANSATRSCIASKDHLDSRSHAAWAMIDQQPPFARKIMGGTQGTNCRLGTSRYGSMYAYVKVTEEHATLPKLQHSMLVTHTQMHMQTDTHADKHTSNAGGSYALFPLIHGQPPWCVH